MMMSFPVGRKSHLVQSKHTKGGSGSESQFLRYKVTLAVLLFLLRHFRQKKAPTWCLSAPLFVKKAEGGRQSLFYVLGVPCGGGSEPPVKRRCGSF